MPDLKRFSVSIEGHLFDSLELLMNRTGCTNRSELVSDLIRKALVENEWDADLPVVGTMTLIYDHHRQGLADRLISLQHDYGTVLATTHVHLETGYCVETMILTGTAGCLREFCGRVGSLKGVLHCSLSMSSTGPALTGTATEAAQPSPGR